MKFDTFFVINCFIFEMFQTKNVILKEKRRLAMSEIQRVKQMLKNIFILNIKEIFKV